MPAGVGLANAYLARKAGMAPGSDSGLATSGLLLSLFGVATQAIGAYYGAESARYEAKSTASRMEFEASMAALGAHQAELEAQDILMAARQEKGLRGLQARALASSMRTFQGAAGVQAGVGSAAEAQASARYAYEADAITIDANAVRASNVARAQAVEFRNRSLLGRTSAANIRRSARTISPAMAGFTSLLGGAGPVALQWARYQNP